MDVRKQYNGTLELFKGKIMSNILCVIKIFFHKWNEIAFKKTVNSYHKFNLIKGCAPAKETLKSKWRLQMKEGVISKEKE